MQTQEWKQQNCSSATSAGAPAAPADCALTAQIPPNGGNQALSGERAASRATLLLPKLNCELSNVTLSLPEKARMPSLCNGNGKAGIRAVKAAQTGIHVFRGLNGFEGKGKVTWASQQSKAVLTFSEWSH